MTDLDRRSFLKTGAAVAAGAAVVGGPFAGFLAAPAVAGPAATARTSCATCPTCATASCGSPCRTASSTARSSRAADQPPTHAAERDARRRVDPARPARRHGAPSRAGTDLVTLVRNHEENGSAVGGRSARPGTPTYDTAALGGTSTVHVTHTARCSTRTPACPAPR